MVKRGRTSLHRGESAGRVEGDAVAEPGDGAEHEEREIGVSEFDVFLQTGEEPLRRGVVYIAVCFAGRWELLFGLRGRCRSRCGGHGSRGRHQHFGGAPEGRRRRK